MIAIVKYNAGNSRSVKNALDRLGHKSVITDNVELINSAEKVIFPGVGEAASAMKYLKTKGLDLIIKELQQPFLGICLGMQLMCRYSEEGSTDCLSIFDAEVKKFPPGEIVPHMGWNNCYDTKGSLFINSGKEDFYFVHSYYVELNHSTSAKCDYILPFSAALQKDNFYGFQFHVEKSGKAGEEVLRQFLEL